MKRVFIKYIAIAVALLATAMTAQAQYHSEGGVSTAKSVSGPDDDGFYTITLESFATGTTTVTENSTPVDVVLVLDISGSMVQPKGSTTNVPNGTNISYNTVKNSDICYFFRDSDGDYDQIYCEEYNGRYYLYYDYGSGKEYIYNGRNGVTTSGNRPTNYAPTTADATIFTAEVNWGTANTVTGSIARIDALKEAVNAFIEEIDHNDAYDSNDNPRPDEDGDGNPDRIGNRISIVTFSNNANTRHGLTPVEGNVSTLQNTVNSFVPAGGTNAAAGMTNANTVLNSANASSNRVVIMFTDGEPNSNTHSTVITNAKTIKDRGVLVFTIGVFTNTPDTGGQIWRYMNYVSSNYPNATGINNAGQGGNSAAGYYKDASASEADLTSIFVSIAQGIGGSTEEIGATTQVRDVVSNSFVIPDGTTASDVKVYTANALTETTWGTRAAYNNATITFVDANGNKITPKADGSVTGAKSIYVEGFDFSKDDTTEGAGDGNWVGQRFNQTHNPQYFWAGKKLIIELKIKANGEATGGTGTATNESTSGVYLKNEDGTYTCINHYDVPHTTLTTTIKIKKTGLRIGESATFEIMKIRPKGWDESKTLEENIANIEYNIIGKPLPNSHEPTGSVEGLTGSDLYKKMGWSSFSKVVLTNKSETNGGEVVKIMRALDPYWVYMVLEDDWGWAYEMSGNNAVDPTTGETTTSMVELNPFSFHNTEKTDVPKHAEAVTINHFGYTISGGAFDGKQEEHYKSSKVKSF